MCNQLLIITNYVSHNCNFVLVMQVSHWKRASKDIFTNYAEIISYDIQITLSWLAQRLTSVKSTDNACPKASQSIRWSDCFGRTFFCVVQLIPLNEIHRWASPGGRLEIFCEFNSTTNSTSLKFPRCRRQLPLLHTKRKCRQARTGAPKPFQPN